MLVNSVLATIMPTMPALPAAVTAAAAPATAGERDRDPRLYIQDDASPPSLFKAVTVLPHETYVTTAT